MRRVAVTGVGAVCPLGSNAVDAFANARQGKSGIRRLNAPFAERLASPIAGLAELDGAHHFDPPRLRMLDRVSEFAMVAGNEAINVARLEGSPIDRSRSGVFVGTGMGGTNTVESVYRTLYDEKSNRIKPFAILMGMYNAPATWLSIAHGLHGPCMTYATACASSAVAIGEAAMRIASGELDLALAGGAEAPLSLGPLMAWEALHTLATVDSENPSASCKPFSKNRTGMVLGEGAAMIVLEPWESAAARNAPIFGEIIGYGLTADIGHITKPSVEGQTAAIHNAIVSAKIDPSEVDAINAHGTGTFANDAVETAAIKAIFGARAYRIPISATKSVHGHLLGATGALECVLSLMAMQRRTLLPTMHLDVADSDCDLDYVPNVARDGHEVRIMLSNSFAFGGTNASLVLKTQV